MKKSHEIGLQVADKIMDDVISKFKIKGEKQQVKIMIHPIIANAMYQQEKDLLEAERFRTIISLSRVLDDATMIKIIESLDYKLTLRKQAENGR